MKKKLIIILLTIITLLSACQKTPTTTVVNNSTTEIQPIETESPIDVDNLTIVTMMDEEVSEVIELGDVTVTLNGTIRKPSTTEGLYIYSAEVIDYSEYESKMGFLFGEYEELIEDRDKLYVTAEDGYLAYVVNTSEYNEKDYAPWGQIHFLNHRKPVSEEEQKVNMTNEEAIAKADETLSRIGVTEFEVSKCEYVEYVLQMTPEGSLSASLGDSIEIYYNQLIQGIPLSSCSIEGRTPPFARVSFYSRGYLDVWISEYDYEPYTPVEECLTYDEALEKFNAYVAKNSKFNGMTYDLIKFEYLITKEYINGNFVTLAVPCWHFYAATINGKANVEDVIINCINGNVMEY